MCGGGKTERHQPDQQVGREVALPEIDGCATVRATASARGTTHRKRARSTPSAVRQAGVWPAILARRSRRGLQPPHRTPAPPRAMRDRACRTVKQAQRRRSPPARRPQATHAARRGRRLANGQQETDRTAGDKLPSPQRGEIEGVVPAAGWSAGCSRRATRRISAIDAQKSSRDLNAGRSSQTGSHHSSADADTARRGRTAPRPPTTKDAAGPWYPRRCRNSPAVTGRGD